MRSITPALMMVLALAACAPAPSSGGGDGPPPLQPIASLDVGRYLGQWHEIAKYPNRFQARCVGPASATYSLNDNGSVRVINRCPLADGRQDEAEGVAWQVGGATSPRLEVRFAPFWLSWLPAVWGDYWVIDLDSDYTLAAVSEPSRQYLWILARSPRVDEAAYQALLLRLKGKGFDLARLQREAGN